MWLRTVWNQWTGKYSSVQFHWHERKRFPEPSHNIYIVGGFSGWGCIVPGWSNKWIKEQWKHRPHPYQQATGSTAEPFVSFVHIRTGECPGNKTGNLSPAVTNVRYRCMRSHKQTQKLVPVTWRPFHMRQQSVERGLAHRAWCERKSFSESIYNLCECDIWCLWPVQ